MSAARSALERRWACCARLLAITLLANTASHATTPRIDLTAATDTGWQEAVIHTAQLDAMERFTTDVAGWRVLARTRTHASVTKHYGARDPKPRELLLGDAAAQPGLVRVVEWLDPRAISIRAAAQPWDTGGIFSLMTRTNDTQGVFAAAERHGWQALNDPVDFALGAIQLRNVVVRGPDGIAIAAYERLSPRMPDDPDLRKLRRPFNSMQTVRDIAATRDFYVRVLGFEVVNSGEFANPRREPNNFGMPADIVADNTIGFAIFAPRNPSPSAVETVQLRGATGRDLAARATANNRGIVSLRFPVSSLERIRTRIEGAGHPLAYAPVTLTLHPYGRILMFGVRTPDGALLEFFEVRN
jgi:catechol 2,3-dioxygenase-like lactoylglutathione lyase family enzyme